MNGTGVCDECADCETGKAAMQQLPVELSVDAIAKRNYEMRIEGEAEFMPPGQRCQRRFAP